MAARPAVAESREAPHLVAAGLAAAVMACCLLAVQLHAWQLEQRYVRSLTGAITPWPEKSRSLAIDRLALGQPDLLPVYGSSELIVSAAHDADDHIIYGDIATVLGDGALHARFRDRVILAHLDLAWGPATDARLHRLVLERTCDWLRPGAWVLSDRAVPLAPTWRLTPLDSYDEVGFAHRFHRYERRPAA